MMQCNVRTEMIDSDFVKPITIYVLCIVRCRQVCLDLVCKNSSAASTNPWHVLDVVSVTILPRQVQIRGMSWILSQFFRGKYKSVACLAGICPFSRSGANSFGGVGSPWHVLILITYSPLTVACLLLVVRLDAL